MNKVRSVALLAAGAALIATGVRQRDSLGGQLGEFFAGSPSDEVLAYLVGGAICALLGLTGLTGKANE